MSADAERSVPPSPSGRTKGRGLYSVLFVLLAGIVVVVLLIVWKRPARSDVPAEALIPVRTLVLAPADLPEIVFYTGLVEADRAVTVAAEQAGRVVEMQAEKGDAVTPGQSLLVLDSSSHTLRVDRADAAYRQATNDLRRAQELRQTGALPDSDYENMLTRAELASIALREARLDLDRCVVRAPVAGVIQDRFAEKGQYLAPGMPAFRIVGADRVKVTVDLPERDVYALRVGDPVSFTVDALAGRTFEGTIRFVAPAADSRSNTFRVEIAADNADGLLKPGVIVRVRLTRRILQGALSLPLTALIPEKGLHVAYVLVNGHAVRREVRLQAMVADRAVVSEGLRAGDRVIVEGHRQVSDGSPVKEHGPAAAPPRASAKPDAGKRP